MHALDALRELGMGSVRRLPVSLRILLESMLRHVDGERVTEEHIHALTHWQPQAVRTTELPFVVARILLQDFTGVPLLCDLAAMRDCAARFGQSPKLIEPQVPVDLVIDHSVQVDHFREIDALDLNLRLEFARNAERYRFLKWGTQAFGRLRIVPPGVGIVHQVNLEHLAPGVHWQGDVCFPDTLVGTDSHTTMINAMGVLGWGVGGIEAEAGMLGLPITILTPDVVGVHLRGQLPAGCTATDLVLTLTERLRQAHVVGQFVEFFGDGAASLSLPDRATLANMAPEYGATVGFFPPDTATADYLRATGRSTAQVDAFCRYFQAQHLFGMPAQGDIDYSRVITLNLSKVEPCVAGPGRPQDRLALPYLGERFSDQLHFPATEGGYGRPAGALKLRVPLPSGGTLGHGDVLIAAITSCTNTSNPGVMLAAGLLARKAVARGLRVAPHIKTSLAPGSRVVSDYLQRAGLLGPLEQLGFRVVAYGCTTCIGNSGPLDPELHEAVLKHRLVCAAVLSGNRNFEARIHPQVQANYLMSPPLVVAFALAGRITLDITHEPLGHDASGLPVFLHELWPSTEELAQALRDAAAPQAYVRLYADVAHSHALWNALEAPSGPLAQWAPSTYIARPPFLDDFSISPTAWVPIQGARALAILGDSITTDHISPAGAIDPDSPAGAYLMDAGVPPADFNSYGARRGNHEVMVRGTFANVRLRNQMLPPDAQDRPVDGGLTLHMPDGQRGTVFDVARHYQAQGVPALVFAGTEYGSGSSRDWAAKGTQLLGVRAVIARSFERIHRANLLGMGVLPLQFGDGDSATSLGLRGDESFDLLDFDGQPMPKQMVRLQVWHSNGRVSQCPLRLRIDTPMEATLFRDGGILPHVMRKLLGAQAPNQVEPHHDTALQPQ